MKRSLRGAAALPMLAFVSIASALPAVAQPTTCTVDQSKPKQLGMATLSLAQAQGSTNPAAKAKGLRDAVKASTEGKATENPAGRDYVLAQALVMWAAEPGMGGTVRRGDLGYTSTPDATTDVLAAADSALTRLQTAVPGCAELVLQLRQQPAWLNLVNGAIGALNANQLDSAVTLASRSLVIYTGSPYAYHVLSTAAAQKADYPAALANWNKLLETAGTDTLYKAMRLAAIYNMGAAQLEQATAASGAAQKTAAETAAATIRRYLAEAPSSPDAPQMQEALARALKLTGDSTAITGVYADMLANPGNHSDLALSQAGVIAAQSKQIADAARLFELALKSNPYQRDALNNLSAMLFELKEYEKMLPIVQRLVEVDPSNPDNYLFAAYAYQGLGKATKVAARQKVFTDSLLKYKALAEKAPVKVVFTQFTRAADHASLAATVENLTSAAPKSYTVKFDFLDAAGTVVASESATVGPVEKGKTVPFTVKVPKGGIVAFRYTPVS